MRLRADAEAAASLELLAPRRGCGPGLAGACGAAGRAHLRRVLGVRRSSLLLALFALFYGVYLATGGLVFAALEAPGEAAVRARFLGARAAFLQRHPCVADEDLEELLQEAVRASNRGVSAARNASGEPNWSFGQALFFSSTVVTTIGYGHVTPLSKEGKLFCMAYAVLGIPLTLVLLSALAERLLVPATLLLQSLNARLGHLYPPFNIRLLHLGLVGGALVLCFVLLPAAAFAALEPDWDFLDAVYYCFISLTTIGLGDYIPGDSPDQPYRPVYKVATTVYLLAGLTFMMLTLTVFYDIPQLNLGLLFVLRADETTGDPEKARLQTPGTMGPKYTQQLDAPTHAPPLHALGAGAGAGAAAGAGGGARRAVVRVKSRRDEDSPSPEDTTPVHARP
ncbi:hypothetical protein R5R35_006411 [Gryllus longicercus]|uniref:Potassium channel domain-containing protein n=1 Tax=Gryllus longicercus TaxID=2509291 RepID=A0AAN9W022_9ORTH